VDTQRYRHNVGFNPVAYIAQKAGLDGALMLAPEAFQHGALE